MPILKCWITNFCVSYELKDIIHVSIYLSPLYLWTFPFHFAAALTEMLVCIIDRTILYGTRRGFRGGAAPTPFALI